MSKKSIALAITGALAAGGLGIYGATEALAKDLTVTVDGQQSKVRTFTPTVGEALAEQGITIREHDEVAPALESQIADGQQISVRYGRLVSLNIDGNLKQVWTTATTVEEALAQLAIRTGADARMSVSRSATIGREGMALTIDNPEEVTIKIGTTVKQVAAFGTVADALEAAGIAPDGKKVTPALTTTLKPGMTITVADVKIVKKSKWTEVAFEVVEKKSDEVYEGEREVKEEGKVGKAVQEIEYTYVDGKLVSTKKKSEKVTTEPVDRVVLIGTKKRPELTSPDADDSDSSSKPDSSGGHDLRRWDMWMRIAYRESTCKWNINTGNGYFGGLQFLTSTWLANGGGKYAPRADLATREEQVTIANRLYDRAGGSPWPNTHRASGRSC